MSQICLSGIGHMKSLRGSDEREKISKIILMNIHPRTGFISRYLLKGSHSVGS